MPARSAQVAIFSKNTSICANDFARWRRTLDISWHPYSVREYEYVDCLVLSFVSVFGSRKSIARVSLVFDSKGVLLYNQSTLFFFFIL